MCSRLLAAVAIIIRPSLDKEILFVRRKVRSGDPWSGDIAFPGGMQRSEDGSLLHTAIRETLEETGIDLKKHKLLAELPYFKSIVRPEMRVKPFIFQLVFEETLNKGEEIEDVFWLKMNLLQKKRVMIKKIGKIRNALVYDDIIIWGLTYRILSFSFRKFPQFF